ncbi:MAG: hypothetical protein AAFP84_14020 [Actinomycetota bacterium]
MAWDSSRPVPWERLVREWLIYVGIMAVVFALLFRDNIAGALAGLLISGPLYLTFGFVLAKLGYQRKSWRDLREARQQAATARTGPDAASTSSSSGSSRSRPAPTSRTSTGRGRPGTKPNRRRR